MKFHSIFEKYRSDPIKNCELAKTIVKAMKHAVNRDLDAFKTMFWKLLWNLKLKGPRSTEVLKRLIDDKFWTPETFVIATDDDLDTECAAYRRHYRLLAFERIEHKTKYEVVNDDGQIEQRVGTLECPKCHSFDTDYLQLQTSRGDEGMTTRAFCNECQYRWKFR